MPMITYDGFPQEPGPLDMSTNVPDEVEVGENNSCWIRLKRSKKLLYLVSKETGAVTNKVELKGNGWSQIGFAYSLGLTKQQVGSVMDALKLPGAG